MNQALNNSLWRTLLPPMLGGAEMPDAQTVAAYKCAIADPAVEKLIFACTNELLQIVTEGGAEHFAHACVQGAALGDTSPREWLEVQRGILQAESAKIREERKTAALRIQQEREAAKPLMDAVNGLFAMASAERATLASRVAQAAISTTPRKSRIQELRSVGLSDEEIARLQLPPAADEEQQLAAWRERVEVLKEQIAKCEAYARDPLRDPEHARGLGFDELVDAQLARVSAAA